METNNGAGAATKVNEEDFASDTFVPLDQGQQQQHFGASGDQSLTDNEPPEDKVLDSKSPLSTKSGSYTRFVRLRGLPFSATEDEIREFLTDVNVESIYLTKTSTGRPSGECYVEVKDASDVDAALALDKKEMKTRYIEVFVVSHEELERVRAHGVINDSDKVVRIRGIPFASTEADIRQFFEGLEVEEVLINKEVAGGRTRPAGDAFIRFRTKEHTLEAMKRDRNNMGSRYIEVFRSTAEEMEAGRGPRSLLDMRTGPGGPGGYAPFRAGPPPPHIARNYGGYGDYGPPPRGPPTPGYGSGPNRGYGSRYDDYSYGDYGRPAGPPGGGYGGAMRAHNGSYAPRASPYDVPAGRGGYGGSYGGYSGGGGSEEFISPTKIFMRGLPFSVTANEIQNFFAPLNCVEIKIGYNEERRPSGDGWVDFGTMAEAREALKRNKNTMGRRYIELFAADQAPPQSKRMTYRVIGGAPAPPPAPLTAPRHQGTYGGSSTGGGYGGASSYNNNNNSSSYGSGGYGYGGGYAGSFDTGSSNGYAASNGSSHGYGSGVGGGYGTSQAPSYGGGSYGSKDSWYGSGDSSSGYAADWARNPSTMPPGYGSRPGGGGTGWSNAY